jgi:ElaB/YqjD/DUF883 family membrane-anchored ribosome-binding protein
MESDRIKGSAAQAGGRVEEVYGEAKDGLRDVVDRASDYAEQAYGQGRAYLAQGSRELNERVETNPLVAIVAAAGIGYLLGLMVRRR